MKKYLLLIAATMLVPYLVGAFVAWEINPGLWTTEGRGTIGGIVFFLFVLSIPAYVL